MCQMVSYLFGRARTVARHYGSFRLIESGLSQQVMDEHPAPQRELPRLSGSYIFFDYYIFGFKKQESQYHFCVFRGKIWHFV